MRKVMLGAVLSSWVCCAAFAQEDPNKGKFLFSPMTGSINSEAHYTVPGSAAENTLTDDGTLYGVYTMYMSPQLVIGNLLHTSRLAASNENGAMIFGYYYFMHDKKFQPTVGLTIENISIYSEIPGEDVAPLVSLDVRNNIWTAFPIAGITYKDSFKDNRVKLECTPFVGYFNEQVNVTVTSPGQKIGTSIRNGFKSSSEINLDYTAAGVKVVLRLFHFVSVDTKLYFRFKQGESTLYTWRNRVDFYLNPKLGITVKNDYFKDKYETNTLLFIGPAFVF
jgi:hypothetical protein